MDNITHATRIVKAMQFAYFIIFMIDKEITMLVVLARALALRYILRCLSVDNQIPIKSAIILSEMLKKCMKINYDYYIIIIIEDKIMFHIKCVIKQYCTQQTSTCDESDGNRHSEQDGYSVNPNSLQFSSNRSKDPLKSLQSNVVLSYQNHLHSGL